MNAIQEINTQCQKLPEDLQQEVLDFIGFLTARYAHRLSPAHDAALTDVDVDNACGILTAPQGISLAQMESAIKSRGGAHDCS